MNEPLGVKHGKVLLVPHDDGWASMFEAERDRIAAACGKLILAIEHVGSTSIPNICAKPIVDIAVGVAALQDADRMEGAMRTIGYDYPRDVGIPDQYIFGRGHPVRQYIVHVQAYESQHWNDYLAFRDRLRGDRQLAGAYETLKLDLARRYPDDRATYGDHKAQFVAEVLARQPI